MACTFCAINHQCLVVSGKVALQQLSNRQSWRMLYVKTRNTLIDTMHVRNERLWHNFSATTFYLHFLVSLSAKTKRKRPSARYTVLQIFMMNNIYRQTIIWFRLSDHLFVLLYDFCFYWAAPSCRGWKSFQNRQLYTLYCFIIFRKLTAPLYCFTLSLSRFQHN